LTGKSIEARAHLARVLELDPRHAGANYRMALALADLGQVEQSLLHYGRAVKANPNVDTSPALHHLLAGGYLEKRQYQEALRHEQQALALAQAQGNTRLAATLRQAVENCRRLAQNSGR